MQRSARVQASSAEMVKNMKKITIKAPAKINLGLDVIRRKENGYHEVRMIMQTVDICDELTFYERRKAGIEIKVDVNDIPSDHNNLIYKAAAMMIEQEEIEKGVSILLKKRIPVAAGMAGGSADAAATFIGLNELFGLGKTKEQLMNMAFKLGADIPFCILGGTALSEGVGEILTPIKRPPSCYIVVAKADIYVSTQYVYENLHVKELKYHPDIDGMLKQIENQNLEEMCKLMGNVLETVTVREYPMIENIKNRMKKAGAINALMSGSGSSVFGIFKEETLAKKAFAELETDKSIKQLFLTTLI